MVRTYNEPHIPVSKEAQNQKQEEYLVGLLIQNQSLYPHVCGLLSEDDFTSPDARTLYSLLGRSSSSDQPFEQLVPSDLKNTVSQFAELVKPKSAIDKVADVKTVINMVARIRRARMLQRNEELQILIREAANTGDKVTERQLRKQVFENRNILSVTYLTGGQS
jgi:replicative DNA helicase